MAKIGYTGHVLGEVCLGLYASGRLLLYHMPGRHGYERSFCADQDLILGEQVDVVVSLAPIEEIMRKSPEYAMAVETGTLPWEQRMFPIPDYGVPREGSRCAFFDTVNRIASDLVEGKSVLLHCGAGVGRIGMVAACVLIALGAMLEDALSRVREVGSEPETDVQRSLVECFATRVHPR